MRSSSSVEDLTGPERENGYLYRIAELGLRQWRGENEFFLFVPIGLLRRPFVRTTFCKRGVNYPSRPGGGWDCRRRSGIFGGGVAEKYAN